MLRYASGRRDAAETTIDRHLTVLATDPFC
jgi:hypothetical protein